METTVNNPAGIPESTVIAQAQQGDREAFQLLYQQYKSYVSTQCRRLGCDASITEDLTQDVFLHLWRKIKHFRGHSTFRTWLHRITVNIIFGHFRKHKRSIPSLVKSTSPSEPPDLTNWASEPCSLDDHVFVSEIMSTLSEGDREILRLYTAGYKHKEIGDMLRITGSTSRSQLYRVRLKVQARKKRAAPARECVCAA